MSAEFTVASPYHSDRRNAVRYIWSHVLRQWWLLISLTIGAFSNAALAAAVPVFVGLSFNAITQPDENTLNLVLLYALGAFASQAVRAVLQLMRNASSEFFAQRIERDVRAELYASLLGKSMTFHDMQPVGDIMARVTNDVRELNLMMNPGFNLLIGANMFLILPAFSAPLIHPQLIIVPLIFIIACAWMQYRFIVQVNPISEAIRVSFGQMNTRLAEALDGLQVVKGAAQEANEKARFEALAETVRGHAYRQAEREARYTPALLLGVTVPLALAHAVWLFQQGAINTGDVVAFMGQIGLFGFPVFSSLFSLSRIASGYASAQRILAILNAETDLDHNPQGYQAPMRGEIRFENVDFGYGDGASILQGISFSVQPGQTVALVGQTGAGKTSLIKLINRTYDARAGRVLVDGVDVRDWNLEALRSQISVIEQDIYLFSRSVAQNIAFGDDSATPADIEDAAQRAQAHAFIQRLPHQYETVVGQRGVTLSGGQRQRLAIARAFESDPPILILDDSTSAIDSATEDRIQKAIWAAAQGRTTLIITHRLSQIRWADWIVVLKQGRIVAQGTHEQLLASSEAYQRIFARYDEPAAQLNATEGKA